MMKKISNLFFFLLTFVAFVTGHASWKEGYYGGVNGGYSKVNGKLKSSGTFLLSGTNRGSVAGVDASKGSYVAGAHFGHRATFGRRHFSAELGVSYTNSSPKVGELTAVGTHAAFGLVNGSRYDLFYKPRFGFGGAIRVGYLFMPELLGYFRLGLDHAIGQYILKGTKKTTFGANVTSLVPGVGFEGRLKGEVYWRTELNYKLAIKASKKTTGLGFTNKPRELVGQFGVGYNF
jgi:hypothetical protein